MEGKIIDWIDNLGKEDNDLFGKKCANLGEISTIGLPVPPGFALSLEAYRAYMGESGLKKKISRILNDNSKQLETISGLNELSEKIRTEVSETPIPEALQNKILDYYKKLCNTCGGEVAVSVRSAGVVSSPGQYETHLNVKGEYKVLSTIRRVWSSTFNTRSLAARKNQGLSLDHDPIGVAVMAMVKAESAGVLFTASPNTGDTSRMIIEANWGLGESVVGGESVPDIYIIDKESLDFLEKKMGSKETSFDITDSGIAEKKTPEHLCSKFCLSDSEAKTIATFGKKLETHFGSSQDVEWAVEKTSGSASSVIMLQTRPAVIIKQKEAIDQVLDFMQDRFGL